ncbi:hypothetical protein BNJ_00066 [Kaumoebavirus]|uniref:hypothetical protein n=1 Tax=Kaumoebavirus TaxID=1859492 RepID=UPI0009C39441|nr:hypothetical protein BNJ_00066 [Kaumoebavirus]ARA71908.1 hypothetical protein BNJ_00066 [Kaumoebavirus]
MIKSKRMSRTEVFTVLSADQQCRVIGANDLCTLEEVNTKSSWDFSLPTIRNDSRKARISCTTAGFITKFYEKYPYLRNVNLENILVAGGCVSGLLTGNSYDDVDFFFYGLSAEEAKIKLQYLLTAIPTAIVETEIVKAKEAEEKKQNYFTRFYPADVSAVRNNNCVTLRLEHGFPTIQFILRVYPNLGDILHSFDLGSSAVGFDKTSSKIYFTTLSKFTYEVSANIIDTTRRSTTYEGRLVKYFEKGFDIILPSLDVTKMRRDYLKYGLAEMCMMPSLKFSYKTIQGNIVEGAKFYLPYHQTSDYQEDINNKWQVFNHNLAKFLSGNSDFYYIAFGEDISSVLSDTCALSANQIILFYNKLKEKIFDGDRLSFKNVKKYLGLTPEEVAAKITSNRKNLDKLIDTKKEEALTKFKALAPIPMSFALGGGPDSQVVGSFNPIVADPENWYGEFYIVEAPEKPVIEDGSDDSDNEGEINYSDNDCSESDDE